MKVKIYAILDDKVGAFMQPFYAMQNGQAIRSLKDALADRNNTICRYPADFTLYHLATFDDTSGEMLPEEKPVFIARASDLIETPELTRELREVKG
jgi:hypothetical protein